MYTYCRNGIRKEVSYILEDTDEFAIQEEVEIQLVDRFFYSGDSIKYTLDAELVALYDLFRDLLFEDIKEYYNECMSLPIWVQEAGQSSDCNISNEDFSEYIEECNLKNIYKHLYLVDCQFLIGTVQNLLQSMEDAFINYYKRLCELECNHRVEFESNTLMLISSSVTIISSIVETYFTKAYSILDIMTKICYEIQFYCDDFSIYKKLKSANVLWGEKKKLKINGMPNTIFEPCELIRIIEAVRNEIVHNGTWELNPRVFFQYEGETLCEKYMLFPDIEQGHLATVKNRRHFFLKAQK